MYYSVMAINQCAIERVKVFCCLVYFSRHNNMFLLNMVHSMRSLLVDNKLAFAIKTSFTCNGFV